jgi:tetratricopeptide (TPR) repeat protein
MNKFKWYWQIVVICVSCVLLYSKIHEHGYVLDDYYAVQGNTLVQSGIKGLGKIFQTTLWAGAPVREAVYSYRPVSVASFAIEYEFFGLNPAASHIVQLCLYIFLCTFIYLLLRKLLEQSYPLLAFFIALLFTFHPIHTEVVSNLKSRDELLSLLFAVTGLYSFVLYLDKQKMYFYGLGLFLYLCSLLSKETSVCFLGIIPLTMYYFYDFSWKKIGKYSLGFGIVFLLFLGMRAWVLSHEVKPFFVPSYLNNPLILIQSFGDLQGTKFYILGKYLQLLILPYNLTCSYFYNDIPTVSFWNWRSLLSIFIYIFLLYYVYISFKQKSIISYGILCYLGGVFLFSHLVIPFAEAMGERLIFTASLGYCIALGGVVYYFAYSSTHQQLVKNIALAVFILIIFLYGLKTYDRHQAWKDAVSLYETDAIYSPNSFMINKSLASWYYTQALNNLNDKTLLLKALHYSQKVNEITPYHIIAWEKHGLLNLLDGNEQKAAYCFQQAINKYQERSVLDKGTIGEFENDVLLAEWENIYASPNSTLYSFPSLSYLYRQIGMSYYTVGKYDKAFAYLKEAEKGMTHQLGKRMVWLDLGVTLLQFKQPQEAIKYLSQFCQLAPNSYDCSNNMGVAYFQLGDYEKASQFFERAFQIMPSSQVLNNLLGVYSQTGNQEKLDYYKKMLQSVQRRTQ